MLLVQVPNPKRHIILIFLVFSTYSISILSSINWILLLKAEYLHRINWEHSKTDHRQFYCNLKMTEKNRWCNFCRVQRTHLAFPNHYRTRIHVSVSHGIGVLHYITEEKCFQLNLSYLINNYKLRAKLVTMMYTLYIS